MKPSELFEINYDEDKHLNVSFKIDEEARFLYCKPVGLIQKGSKGNNSTDYLFGKICQYYFQTHCYVLILDFSELKYEYGDRLQKALNFFSFVGRDDDEKRYPILLIKPKESKGIDELIDWVKPPQLRIVKNMDEAVKLGADLFHDYIK